MGLGDPSGRICVASGGSALKMERAYSTDELVSRPALVSTTCPYGSFVTTYVSRWRRSAFLSTRSCRPGTCRRKRSTCSAASGSRPTGCSSCSAALRQSNPRYRSWTWPMQSKGRPGDAFGGAVRRHLRQGGRDGRPRGSRGAETDGVEPHGQRPEGRGPRRDVEVHVRRHHHDAVLEVADSGPGFGGLPTQHGHGLVGVRRFAKRFGGDICVGASSLGGALVTLRLPLALGHAASCGQ